jgi:hypothetical protein
MIGSILQDKYGNICTLEAIQYNGLSTNKHSGLFNEFYAIHLTEKILTEWCKDFEHSKEYDKYYKYKTNNIAVSFADNKVRVVNGNFVCSIVVAENPPLHLFQMLILSLTNEPLKITLP